MQELPFPDRRKTTDRRARPTFPLSRASLFGERKQVRRREDRFIHYYVDKYSLRSAFIVFCIVALSVTDSIFTLRLIELGAAREANPVMDFFLQLGTLPFLIVKYTVTGLCLVWLLVMKNRTFFMQKLSVKSLIVAVLIIYVTLIGYELTLFYRFSTQS